MALALDRKAFIDILSEGKADIGGAMLPPPEGVWGMPPEMLATIPGYGPDVEKNRAEARKLMEKAGYGPDKRLKVKVSTRNIADLSRPRGDPDRPAQEIYIDGELEVVDTAHLVRQGRAQGLHGRPEPDRHRRRRSGPVLLRELRLQLGAQLHRLLQPGDREAVRRSSRRRPTSTSASRWSGRSTRSCRRTSRGRSSSTPAGDLLAAGREGLHA